MPEDKIMLDKKTFRALAVDTRVKILKSLIKRRKTLSELKSELEMSPSSVKEHLDILLKVKLIKKIDDEHKWKYYEITRKGRSILGSKETKVWIVLALAIVAAVGLAYKIFLRSMITLGTGLARAPVSAEKVQEAGGTLGAETTASGLPWIQIIFLAATVAIACICIYHLWKRRR